MRGITRIFSTTCAVVVSLVPIIVALSPPKELSRRSCIQEILLAPALLAFVPEPAFGEDQQEKPFVTAGFPKKEYTNSIVASRDTNISPLEVYDTIQGRLRRKSNNENARALDVGAGAGVSTQVIYQQLGYVNIDAVDWSGDAWEANVVEGGYCPPTVNFYALDDERFVAMWKKQGLPKYDIIAFNFAVNSDKALYFCRELLKPDGLLLAPINTQRDYWLKQTYQLLDAEGRVAWSANDVGAWAVQFQPDVTADTCQGIWCAPFNGFQKLRVYK
jgi:SAM-dependent methyltransferase